MGGKCTVRPYMDEAWTEEQRNANGFEPMVLLEKEHAGCISFDEDATGIITVTGYNAANSMVFRAFTSSLATVWIEQGIEVPGDEARSIIMDSIRHRQGFMTSFRIIDQFRGFLFLGRLAQHR